MIHCIVFRFIDVVVDVYFFKVLYIIGVVSNSLSGFEQIPRSVVDPVRGSRLEMKKLPFLTGKPPRGDGVERAILSASVIGAYANKLFSQYLSSFVDYAAFCPMAPIWDKCNDRELKERFLTYHEHHQETFTHLDFYFNGIQTEKRYEIEMKGRSNDKSTPKVQGMYRYCTDLIRLFFEYSSNADRKIEIAVVKSILYSMDESNYTNEHALKLLFDYGSKLLGAYSDKYESLESYTRITRNGRRIMDGEDPIRVNIISNEGSHEEGLLEYIDCSVLPSKCPRGSDDRFYVLQCKLFQAARIMSTMDVDPQCRTFTLNYDDNHPPLANYSRVSKKAVSLRKFDILEPVVDSDDNLENTSRETQSVDIGVGSSQVEVESYSVPDLKAKTNESRVSSDVLEFVRYQHERLKLKRLLCVSFNELTDRYVDIKFAEDGTGLMEHTYGLLIKQRSVLIHGSGGMGKSTLSYLIYQKMYENFMEFRQGPVPVIVSPKVFSDEGVNRRNLMRHVIRDCNAGLNEDASFDDLSLVLFIDAIDEYYKPESEELETMLLSIRGYTKLVTGRSEVSRTIAYAFDDPPVDLGDSVDGVLFSAIVKKYSSANGDESIDEFIGQLRGLESTPLVAAMISTHLSSNKISYVNGRPIIGAFYNDVVQNMIFDKIRTINKSTNGSLTSNQASNILCEYAWTRYRYPIMNYVDRISRVREKTGLDADVISKLIVEFTESDNSDDRLFLHMSIQDYLVAKWVVRQSSQKTIDDEFLHVMFRSEVHRFIGDFMKLNPPLALQVTAFSIRLYRECNDIDDELLRNNYQTKIIYLLSRASFVGNRQASIDVDAQLRRILSEDRTTPQLAMALLCVTMLGDMAVEESYARRIRDDRRFAEIARILYLVYEGDMDSMNLEMEDSRGHFNNVIQGYLEDVGEYNLRDDRCKCLCRTQTMLMETLISEGYLISEEQKQDIRNLDDESIAGMVMTADFIANLERCGIETEQYRASLIKELRQLKDACV